MSDLLELLQLKLSEAKDTLVTCNDLDVARWRSEAKTYDALLRSLTRPAPTQAGAD